MERPLRYTYDGLPIAPDQPYGAAIVVRRRSAAGDSVPDYLVLHRAHQGPDYEGAWAWTPPSGSRQPGESVLGAALRELAEETGLVVAATDLRVLDLSGPWAPFAGGARDSQHSRRTTRNGPTAAPPIPRSLCREQLIGLRVRYDA